MTFKIWEKQREWEFELVGCGKDLGEVGEGEAMIRIC